jgi:hypothetical protein
VPPSEEDPLRSHGSRATSSITGYRLSVTGDPNRVTYRLEEGRFVLLSRDLRALAKLYALQRGSSDVEALVAEFEQRLADRAGRCRRG